MVVAGGGGTGPREVVVVGERSIADLCRGGSMDRK